MGTRICVMNAAEVQQIDTPDRIYHHPRNTFVAAFLGDPPMNLLQGRLRREAGGRLACMLEDQAVPVPERDRRHLDGRADRPVVLGIRPEDVFEASGAPARTSLYLRVRTVELLGRENIIYAECGSQSVTVRAPHHFRPASGETVLVSFDPERLHWFDPESGESLTTADELRDEASLAR